MIKIAALNEESDEESDSEEEVTREALEQIALQQYSRALELLKKGNFSTALELLKGLLETELLFDVKKPAPGDNASEPLFNLKYLCYKNLAIVQAKLDNVDAAIESYLAASELDDSDITLWNRLGQMCFQAKKYEMALFAFQKGVLRNPKHWPCIDKSVTLLLGLGYYEDCIAVIHKALELDPGYLRGTVYRNHIYIKYPYIKDFMEYTDAKFTVSELNIDLKYDEKAKILIEEAEKIKTDLLEQEDYEKSLTKSVLPTLALKEPIKKLDWLSVGISLVSMHRYMTENCFSHACFIDIICEKENFVDSMEVDSIKKDAGIEAEIKSIESEAISSSEKSAENCSENENNDVLESDKVIDNEKVSDSDKANETDKQDSDVEMNTAENNDVPKTVEEMTTENKEKKSQGRRRGCDLSFLQQWEWCNKRRSARKKPVTIESNDTIYQMLRKIVPNHLSTKNVENNENGKRESSPDVSNLDRLYEVKESAQQETESIYFNTDVEQQDVENFIKKFTEQKSDIIEIIKQYVLLLSSKWQQQWPECLYNIFIEANKCYSSHIDIPACTDNNIEEIMQFVSVNILSEEFIVNNYLKKTVDRLQCEMVIIESINYLVTMKPHIFGKDCLYLFLRSIWVKLHANLVNKNEEAALDCLYQLVHEFNAMGECKSEFSLTLKNFTFKPCISEKEILKYIIFLERNKQLSTVMDLFQKAEYENVLTIVIDSFEHCRKTAKDQQEEMSLDLPLQMTVILDAYWALERVGECFKWSFVCLHEALKHYFRLTSGSTDYDRWSIAIVKILSCMEHILKTEGLVCLEDITQEDLSYCLEDLIRIIGHQVETNTSDMPLDTVLPWIIMHYILQREEDQGRVGEAHDKSLSDEIPNPLMILFIAHEQLGSRGWCCKNDGLLLYFTLDTVVPRIRSPSLNKCLSQVLQYMEQCVYCLFGHPSKKNNKIKYLEDHNATPHNLDWARAQQVYEIFRPLSLPELHGKVTALTADTEQLFLRILSLMPAEYELQKYIGDVEKFITGKEVKMPEVSTVFPYKMKDIYFLLGDYYFKKEEGRLAIKYNMIDILLNNNRFESWAQITLAKGINIERILNSCNNINNERDFMKPAHTIIRCFERTLQLESNCDIWMEYGVFSYAVHSFCSRLLKQASESLSMEDFESLENQKDQMLDTCEKCFNILTQELKRCNDEDKIHEAKWLSYYLLGKVSEKRNKAPSIYLSCYAKAVEGLAEADAVYPSKINYNSPQNFSIEVLELHYRIHASILKYIEQHENKPIPYSVGKTFLGSIEKWKNGPFSKRAKKLQIVSEIDSSEHKSNENLPQAANILKRSISDVGEEDTVEIKKIKLENAAAKVKRSASYDAERTNRENAGENVESSKEITKEEEPQQTKDTQPVAEKCIEPIDLPKESKPLQHLEPLPNTTVSISEDLKVSESEQSDVGEQKKSESSSSTSLSSSTDSSSSDSLESSSSDSSRNTTISNKSVDRNLNDDEIIHIITECILALEECVSRFPLHYKALYRIAHYHFYYKKGKDIERCRDIMLSHFMSKVNYKLGGLFSERKTTNFFNNIWRIPLSEIDRPGGFANHMNRCVLLTLEILKEIDDHKTLLDIGLQLNRIPDPDKKYLRDSDREELAQQATSLCIQSLKGQLTKFGQQQDLRSNEIETKAFNSLMLDIYRAYQRVQKQPSSKQFTNLLVEGYKLVASNHPENANLVDLSMRYCQSLIQALKQQATQASMEKNNAHKKHTMKVVEVTKAASVPVVPSVSVSNSQPMQPEVVKPTQSASVPKISSKDIANAFTNYVPMLNDPVLSQQAAAAFSLSYLSGMSAMTGYAQLQKTLQSSLQNTFQAEFYRQFLGQNFSSLMAPGAVFAGTKKQKRPHDGTKSGKTKIAMPSSSSITQLKATSSKPSTSSVLSSHSQAKQNVTTNSSSIPSQVKNSLSAHQMTSMSSAVSIKPNTSTSISTKPNSSIKPHISSSSMGQKMTSSVPTALLPKSSSVSSNNYKSPATTASNVIKTASNPLLASMGTVLSTLPPSMASGLTSTYNPLPAIRAQTTMSKSNSFSVPKSSNQTSPTKTLQEKLAEKQKSNPLSKQSSMSQALSVLGRLPSSLSVSKTSVKSNGSSISGSNNRNVMKSSSDTVTPKPICSDEVIVLDDD